MYGDDLDPWRLAAVLLGPIAGSFIGLLSLRLPAGRTVLWGRSRCGGCERTLGIVDHVPIASFLAMGGRCRTCRAPIPPRYLLLELAALSIGIMAAFVDAGPLALAGAIFGWGLMASAVIDGEHFLLPDQITLPLGVLGLVAAFLVPELDVGSALGGAAVGFIGLYLLAYLFRRIRGVEGLGGGDPRLFGAIGAWVGWQGLPSVLVSSCLAGLAVVVGAILTGRGWTAERRLPFGVFLALGAWIVWLVGPIGT